MAKVLKGWGIGLVGLALLVQQVLFSPTVQAADCFKSVYAFGDGIFDTGSISAVFPSILNYDFDPYGSTHFGKPSGRFSDGRLVLDFLSEALGLPPIPSYAQTVSSDFSKGISFASAFSTISKVTTGQTAGPFMFLNPFALGVQLDQYLEFRGTTSKVYAKSNIPNTKRSMQEKESETDTSLIEEFAQARLPENAEFSKGLYLVCSGAHDILNFYNLNYTTQRIEATFPKLLSAYYLTVRSLSKVYGVKNIIIFDVEPLGCQPFLLTLIPHTPADLDPKGCLIAQNALVQRFNMLLKRDVKSWRANFNSNIVYLSQYDIKIDLMKDAESGITTLNAACCGVPASPYNVLIPVPCGPSVFDPATNATLQATACTDPSTHLYWDGMYTTEAANKYITKKILSGKYFDIPFDTLSSCVTGALT